MMKFSHSISHQIFQILSHSLVVKFYYSLPKNKKYKVTCKFSLDTISFFFPFPNNNFSASTLVEAELL